MRGLTAMERFLKKVDQDAPDGCWRWTAGNNRRGGGGYGVFYEIATRDDAKQVLAHRFSYEAFVGPIPQGMDIDHLCRNIQCVNPKHLEVVTHRENIRRGRSPAADNARKTHCPNGHPFDEEHTYRHGERRQCRPCRNAYSRAYIKTYKKRKREGLVNAYRKREGSP